MTQVMSITVPNEITQKAKIAVNFCDSVMEVKSQEEANNANEFLKKVKADYKFLESKRTELKAPLLQETRELDAFFKEYTDQLLKAENRVKSALSLFLMEERRKLQELEQKAILIAKEEEDKKRDVLEARAEKAEVKGKIEKAEALREQAESVHVVAMITQQPTKLTGTSMKMKTVVIIDDINAIPPIFYLNNPSVVEAIQKVMNTFAQSKAPISGVRYDEVPAISTRI